MKDYYQILGVTHQSSEEEIRKRYRTLAMQYHPDRNPDDPAAEEKFKEVAEAYGVLTDPQKRRDYERCRAAGRNYEGQTGQGDFNYSQEDILRDLFQDPRFQQLFAGLLREFQRSGFRYSGNFIRKAFFGGKGGIFVGGIFLIGSLAGPLLGQAARKSLPKTGTVLKNISSKVSSLLDRKSAPAAEQQATAADPLLRKEFDTTYHTPLTSEELAAGKTIQVLVYGDQGEQTLQVKIPAGSKSGQRLRLSGKGRLGPYGRGDLYLQLVDREEAGTT